VHGGVSIPSTERAADDGAFTATNSAKSNPARFAHLRQTPAACRCRDTVVASRARSRTVPVRAAPLAAGLGADAATVLVVVETRDAFVSVREGGARSCSPSCRLLLEVALIVDRRRRLLRGASPVPDQPRGGPPALLQPLAAAAKIIASQVGDSVGRDRAR
jgi:hypothetical protein